MSFILPRISLRLMLLLVALASALLATWQVNQNCRRLRLEGQMALAQSERDVLLIGIHRRVWAYGLEEDRPFGPHDPAIDLQRHDNAVELEARLDEVDEFLKAHSPAH